MKAADDCIAVDQSEDLYFEPSGRKSTYVVSCPRPA